MPGFISTERLARVSARRPWAVVALWAAIVAAAIVGAGQIRFDEEQEITTSDSHEAKRLVEELRGGADANETIVVMSLGPTVDDAEFKSYVGTLVSRLRLLDDNVASVTSYYETGDESLVSDDRREMIIPLSLTGSRTEASDTVKPVLDVLHDGEGSGFRPLIVGDGSLARGFEHAFKKDLEKAEMIGLPAALIVLVLVFGAAMAAGVPVVMALLGIVISVGITGVLSRMFGVNSMVVNMITMIGLAVGIDYTLFIIERFREERARGVEKVAAIAASGATASRAVLFSGITVLIALSAMFVVPATTFRGLAIGAVTAVFVAVAAALTLLPAVLSLLGDRINWLHLPGRNGAKALEDEDGFWGRMTNAVMRRPVVAIAGCVTLLVAASVPVLTINLGTMGLREFPDDLEAMQAFRVLDRDFSAGRIAPAEVVLKGDVTSPKTQAAVEELRQALAADPAYGEVSQLQISDEGDLGALQVLINGDAMGPDARDAASKLRSEYIPQAFDGRDVSVVVGGTAAANEDYVSTMVVFMPVVVAFILTLSFVLLMLVFRSIVIPVKAILMNLLSVGAAYGLIVLVFQHGVGAGLLGFHQSDSIEAFLPIFLFAILFGLSMDYHVFLLSRIQERFLQTGDNRGAVAYGLRSTAHIITGAAAIMVVVFAGFAMGDIGSLQQMGFGLAVAVFIDATIVRSILVPATMEMLGELNWYFPRWLSWLPTISVEGAGERRGRPAYGPAPVFATEAAGGGGD
ncbi:MAG TPA: MMPL family transporter [Dehalococcoidia bacterium]|nr:MMPL family transporter [Dehalococcoidia bacterium]